MSSRKQTMKEQLLVTNKPGNNNCKRCKSNKTPEGFEFDKTSVGMYEDDNCQCRAQQEDALIAFELEGFQKLSSDERKSVLQTTIIKMQNDYGESCQGSTLTGTLCWKADNDTIKTVTASVGDSTSYLIILDKNNQFKTIKRLNIELHNPENEQEKVRVENAGGFISKEFGIPRLNGKLAITRAIGDNDLDDYGLSHDPSVDIYEYQLKEAETAFLVVACDGLTESNDDQLNENAGLNQTEIGKLVSHHSNKKPEEIAGILVNEALASRTSLPNSRSKHASTDNVSVAVMKIANGSPKGVFVFDGHGGKTVSNNLGNHFYPALKAEVDNKLNKEKE